MRRLQRLAGAPEDPRGPGLRVAERAEQRGLADPGLAADKDQPPLAGRPDAGEQLVERGQVAGAFDQAADGAGGHDAHVSGCAPDFGAAIRDIQACAAGADGSGFPARQAGTSARGVSAHNPGPPRGVVRRSMVPDWPRCGAQAACASLTALARGARPARPALGNRGARRGSPRMALAQHATPATARDRVRPECDATAHGAQRGSERDGLRDDRGGGLAGRGRDRRRRDHTVVLDHVDREA